MGSSRIPVWVRQYILRLSEHGLCYVRLFWVVDPVELQMFPFALFAEASDVALPHGLLAGINENRITHEFPDILGDLSL